jgi:hypothetical protein
LEQLAEQPSPVGFELGLDRLVETLLVGADVGQSSSSTVKSRRVFLLKFALSWPNL